jgi:tetratricopeptide (TPR) repeat protein
MDMRHSCLLMIALTGTNVILVQQVAFCKTAEEVGAIATAITVEMRSTNNSNTGSGVLLQHKGDLYTILTAGHVVKGSKIMTVKTADGFIYKTIPDSIRQASSNLDLAVVKFRSNKKYSLAKISNSTALKHGSVVYVAGFPGAIDETVIASGVLNFVDGKVTGIASQGNKDGYSLIYGNQTSRGMSGGPVLNENGDLVAIHGQGERDGEQKTGRNLGIVIERFWSVALAMGVQLDQQITTTSLLPKRSANAVDYYLIASEKADAGDYQGAIDIYSQAISFDRKYALAYVQRGFAKSQIMKDGKSIDRDGALADLNKAISIEPNLSLAYAFRGLVKAINRSSFTPSPQEVNGSLADYNRAIALDSKLALTYVLRGFLFYNDLKDNNSAILDYSRAIALDATYALAYLFRGILTDDKSAKIQDWQRAAQLFRQQKKAKFLQDTVNLLKQEGVVEY